jgi:hypothetical protein
MGYEDRPISIQPPDANVLALTEERMAQGRQLHAALASWSTLAREAKIDSPFEMLDATATGFRNDIYGFRETPLGKDVESLIVVTQPIPYHLDSSYITVTNTGHILILPSWLSEPGAQEHPDNTQVGLMLRMKRTRNVCAGLSAVLERAVPFNHPTAARHGVNEQSGQAVLNASVHAIMEQLAPPSLTVPEPPR